MRCLIGVSTWLSWGVGGAGRFFAGLLGRWLRSSACDITGLAVLASRSD